MASISHTVSPAQADIITEMKRISDTANNQLNNAIAIIIAGVAPVGSKLIQYDNGVMTIELPESKITDKDKSVVGEINPAVEPESAPKPE